MNFSNKQQKKFKIPQSMHTVHFLCIKLCNVHLCHKLQHKHYHKIDEQTKIPKITLDNNLDEIHFDDSPLS